MSLGKRDFLFFFFFRAEVLLSGKNTGLIT